MDVNAGGAQETARREWARSKMCCTREPTGAGQILQARTWEKGMLQEVARKMARKSDVK